MRQLASVNSIDKDRSNYDDRWRTFDGFGSGRGKHGVRGFATRENWSERILHGRGVSKQARVPFCAVLDERAQFVNRLGQATRESGRGRG